MSADRWIDVEDLIADEIGICVWDPDGQREAAQRVLTALIDTDLLVEPDTWAIPAEPGPEVVCVRDVDGWRWSRQTDDVGFPWVTAYGPHPEYMSWSDLVAKCGPLTDDTEPMLASVEQLAASLPTPAAASPAGAAPVGAPTSAPGGGGAVHPAAPPP